MSTKQLNITTVNTSDKGGGAEQLAWTLFKGYQQRGHRSSMAVGNKKSADPDVVPFFASQHVDYRRYNRWSIKHVQATRRWLTKQVGIEDFNFPYTKYLLQLHGPKPDIVHIHNLHGGYFDLQMLAGLSKQIPVFITASDSWLFTGHCAQPISCERWRSGCGSCPDLTIEPQIKHDATRYNLRRKQRIYDESQFFVAAPSHWMSNSIGESVLSRAVREIRYIPLGVDLQVFRPGSKSEARREYNIPDETFVISHVSHRTTTNPFKDYATMRRIAARFSERPIRRPVEFLFVGDQAQDQVYDNVSVRHIPFVASREELANIYRASDVYFHLAHAETFGTVIAEAMACGLPAVASRIGGIPDVVTADTGFLVEPGVDQECIDVLHRLMNDDTKRSAMSAAAAVRATQNFSLSTMIDRYLDWFQEVLERFDEPTSRAA